MTITAIISLKVCSECGARAPIGWEIEHQGDHESPQFCTVERGPWPLEEGDEVVNLTVS